MKVNSFIGLRFFLISLVFVSHCTLLNSIESTKLAYRYLAYGGFCVEIFIILSGFCIYLGYNSKFNTLSLKSVVSFVFKRFSKLYPAYLLSNVAFFIAFYFVTFNGGITLSNVSNYLHQNYKSYLAVIFMLQAWNPSLVLTGNSASWFISAIFLSYVLAPFFIFAYNKINSKCSIFILFFIINALRAFANLKLPLYLKDFLEIPENMYRTFVYSFPLFRFFDFISGIVLCDIFLRYNGIIKEKISSTTFFIIECISIAALFISPVFFRKASDLYVRALFYNLMIFVFAMDKGLLSKLFSTETAKSLGNISLYFYLFHYPLVYLPLYCFPRIVGFILNSSKYMSILYTIFLYIILFFATITLSLAYSTAINKFSQRKTTKTLDVKIQ